MAVLIVTIAYTFCVKNRKTINKISLKNICTDYIMFLYGSCHKNFKLSKIFNNEIEFTIVQLAHRLFPVLHHVFIVTSKLHLFGLP